MTKYILILTLVGLISASDLYDPSTYSNKNEVHTTHRHLDVYLNFNKSTIEGSITLTLNPVINNLTQVILDTQFLQIFRVENLDAQTNETYNVDLNGPYNKNLGAKLTIGLSKSYNINETFQLKITYSTSSNATALSWLTKEQTSTKVAPYLFSQCESIWCRSVAPLQDTPSIKSTYTADIRVDTPNIFVYMSANSTGVTNNSLVDGSVIFHFENSIPTQSYLMAIIAGNVERRQIGIRTGVITEPSDIDRCANELSDLETFLSTVENYTLPYIWGIYNIVILPPSFPMGGMENPLLTFASPTIIVGDKSEVNVAIHEIAHSWTGNLVTNQNWGSFWLNEGFTVFLERKGLQILYGKDFQKVAAYEGNASLTQDIISYGVNNPYTALYFDIGFANPDDAFSTVPYERGYQLLQYVENVVGEQLMQEYLRAYVQEYRFQSITNLQFVDFFYKFFLPRIGEVAYSIELDSWLYVPGYPPAKNNFSTSSIQTSKQLAHDYLSLNGTVSPSNYKDYFSFFTNLKLIFFETINESGVKLNEQLIKRLNTDYELDNQKSISIRSIWYTITVYSGYKDNLDLIDAFLGQVGRNKYITPIYQALVGVDLSLAESLYNKHSSFYHPITRAAILRILNAAQQNIVSKIQAKQVNKFLAMIE